MATSLWLLFNPLSPNIHRQILQTDLHTSPLRISWENLIKDHGIFSMMINLLILITLSLDSVWILLGENCCWSLLGLKGLKPLYNCHLFTTATFFCLQGGRCREVTVTVTFKLNIILILHCICTFTAVTNNPEPGISPGYYERQPHFFHTWVKNKRKMEPKELLSWAIPLLIITYTRQLEILATTRYYNKPMKYYSFIVIHSFKTIKIPVFMTQLTNWNCLAMDLICPSSIISITLYCQF